MRLKLNHLILCAISAIGLAGCGTADHYSPRAEIMNKETATAKSNQILTNILRAAYREPLQFTDTTSITGTASVTASIGSSLPVAGNPAGSAQLFNIMPGASVSEGPTFSIANLNTQEFYQGIQTPIDIGPIGSYKNSNKDFGNLLSLSVSDVEFDTPRAHIVVHNTFNRKVSYSYFRSLIDDLIRAGLSIETVAATQKIGPVLSKTQATNPELLSGVVRAYGQAASADSVPLIAGIMEKDGKESRQFFQFTKASKKSHFCFLPLSGKDLPYIDADVLSKSSTKTKPRSMLIRLGYSEAGPRAEFNVASANFCGQSRDQEEPARPSTHKLTDKLSLRTRSVEQMIYFLGDMVRDELGLDPSMSADLEVRDYNNQPVDLFRIRKGLGAPGDIHAEYRGQSYYVAADPTGTDASVEIIQLLTELIALESSAKSYPTPNIIAVATP